MYIDENGDAAGNYTILGAKLVNDSDSNQTTYGLYPFGTFITFASLGENENNTFPVRFHYYLALYQARIHHNLCKNKKLLINTGKVCRF